MKALGNWHIGTFMFLAIILLPFITLSTLETSAKPQSRIEVNSSEKEIEQSVLKFLSARFKVMGAPKFLMKQSISAEDAAKLGLVPDNFYGGQTPPPLILTVVQGRFEVVLPFSSLGNGSRQQEKRSVIPEYANYVVYLIDKCYGYPITTGYTENYKDIQNLLIPKTSKTRRRQTLKRTRVIPRPKQGKFTRASCPKPVLVAPPQTPTTVPPTESGSS
jgi:hypothetical protein